MWPALVLLDRDGVINADSPDAILTPDQWQPLPGSLKAMARLTAADIPVVIVTNQAAIGRGRLSEETLSAIHQRLRNALTEAGGVVSEIFFCPHAPDVRCGCRKPAPAMIHEALARFETPANEAVFIGDSARDLQAAEAAGVPAWLVRTGNGQTTARDAAFAHVPVFDDLAAAVDALTAPHRAAGEPS